MNNINRIQFEKPDIADLQSRYTVVDMHFHSNHSDGIGSIKKIARQARTLNIGVALTDHNAIKGAVEINRYKDLLTIPGIELTSSEGTHLLVYFYDIKSLKRFYKNDVLPFFGNDVMSSIQLHMEEIVRRARNYKTVIIFPHPYCAAYTGICNYNFSPEQTRRLFNMVDGVEVINSENVKKWNLQSAVLGFNLNKAITGGSDGHSIYQMGRVVTYADCKKTRKAFLDAVKKKNAKVIGKEIHLLRKMKSNGLKLRSNIRNYPDLLEKNLKYSYTVLNLKSKHLKDNFKREFNDRIKKGLKSQAS